MSDPGSFRTGHVGATGGHLDIDDLDRAIDLDVIDEGHDRPRLGERLGQALEHAGISPWARAHRLVVRITVGALVMVLVAGGIWWLRRPVPLPDDPRVLVTVAGPDPTAALVLDPGSDRPSGVVQTVLVATAEQTGVRLELIGLTGPGLAEPTAAGTQIDTDRLDRPVSVSGALTCATPESSTEVMAASADDYGLALRRTAPEGETRVDPLPFVGAQRLHDLVRAACLQIAADRDLRAASVAVRPVTGVVAADIIVDVVNPSPRQWLGLRVSPAAQPVIVNGGPRADLTPGGSGRIAARLWPTDCADPAGPLADGLPLRVELGPDGSTPASASTSTSPTFLLRLPATAERAVAEAFTVACAGGSPTVVIDRTEVGTGPVGSSAGVIDLLVRITAPAARFVEANELGALVPGQLSARVFPVPVLDGVATLDVHWVLPTCGRLQGVTAPRASIRLAGEVSRPYVVELRGEELRTAIRGLCGDDIGTAPSVAP